MSSPRRAYDALVRWTVAAYDSGQAPFFLRTTRYEPLAQDSLSIKRPRFRVPPCRTRVFAYLAAALSVVLLFAVYTRGSSLSVGFDASRAAISKEDFIAAVVRDPVEGLLDLGPQPMWRLTKVYSNHFNPASYISTGR